MMKKSYASVIVSAGILFCVTAAPGSLAAQAEGQAAMQPGIQAVAMQPASPVAAGGAAPSAVGPIVEPLAFHRALDESRVVADQSIAPPVNRGLAMTLAGIAAVGVGYVVKGTAGTALAFGGGALALYGIYHWIK